MHSPGLDDSELLRRARVDANAFAAFYRRHARAVYRALLSDCGDPDVALGFAGGAGGYVAKPGLSRATPVEVMTDSAPGTLRVYRLAMDGVTAISLRARGVTRQAVVARNAFYLEANSLGNRKGFAAALIVRYRDGSTRQVPLRIGGYERRTPKLRPRLPGLVPVANTAA